LTRFVRYLANGDSPAWGLLEGDSIRKVSANPVGPHQPTGDTIGAFEAHLLAPAEPPKIFAVGRNYKSHLGDRPAPKQPEIFFKPITALQNPGGDIVIPQGAKNVHFEGELVLVIGKKLKKADRDEAREAIWGVTCGNDVSERDWQAGPEKDLQWWRAKGSDTFAPLGPVVVRGLDYSNLMLETRLNGEVVQRQTTADLLFDPATIVSYISETVTLQPGDLIYTGTPGTTKKMNPGDVIEVEVEGIGILRNKIVAG